MSNACSIHSQLMCQTPPTLAWYNHVQPEYLALQHCVLTCHYCIEVSVW